VQTEDNGGWVNRHGGFPDGDFTTGEMDMVGLAGGSAVAFNGQCETEFTAKNSKPWLLWAKSTSREYPELGDRVLWTAVYHVERERRVSDGEFGLFGT